MKLSELIIELQDKLKVHGDIEVFDQDMNELTLDLCADGKLEDADSPTFGKTYLCIG